MVTLHQSERKCTLQSPPVTEKNNSIHPLQNAKNGLKSSWGSRGHIQALQIYINVHYRLLSGVAIACAERLPAGEIVLQIWGRVWVSTPCARRCVCVSSPLPPQPGQTAAWGSSSASSLQPQVKAFPQESIQTKRVLADIPELYPMSAKQQDIPEQGTLYTCVFILWFYDFVYTCINVSVHTKILHTLCS